MLGLSQAQRKSIALESFYHTIQTFFLLSEIQRNGHQIEFDVLYYAQGEGAQAIREEIGNKEGELIR